MEQNFFWGFLVESSEIELLGKIAPEQKIVLRKCAVPPPLYACITMDVPVLVPATWRDEKAGCMAAACETFMTTKKGKQCYVNLRNVRVLHGELLKALARSWELW